MRKPYFAGSFYPKSEGALRTMIEKCFTGERGPSELPAKPKKDATPLKAVIVPHAGYQYSGMAAAWSFAAIAESALPDVFIILSPNHNSSASGISIETFQTPLGEVRVDQEFARALAEKGTLHINEAIHIPEHGIEVQLPMLQYVLGSRAEKLKIVPILVSSDIDLKKAVLDIQETIIDLKRNVTFIVSSDFTHYGRSYHFMPFYKDIKENLSELDGKAFAFLQALDLKGFEEFVDETQINICGYYPLLLLLRLVKSQNVLLEQYYVSGDVTGDYKNSVSYASLVFK